ncbi:hypothetical protein ACFFLM_13670 [Deinococcus oregonensis]|uniref:Uncharacterized protein n=1 Tax=Deinococcus oregonensis TaxID=1805970 RepID=A0ABV6AZU8_9DEIO
MLRPAAVVVCGARTAFSTAAANPRSFAVCTVTAAPAAANARAAPSPASPASRPPPAQAAPPEPP